MSMLFKNLKKFNNKIALVTLFLFINALLKIPSMSMDIKKIIEI